MTEDVKRGANFEDFARAVHFIERALYTSKTLTHCVNRMAHYEDVERAAHFEVAIYVAHFEDVKCGAYFQDDDDADDAPNDCDDGRVGGQPKGIYGSLNDDAMQRFVSMEEEARA